MSEEFETKSTDDGYEDICFICRRPESKAGKMFKMPGNMTICMDCMEKTMDRRQRKSREAIFSALMVSNAQYMMWLHT